MTMTTPLPVRALGLNRDSAFSYRCHACQRCCQDKLIRVNPYEVMQLARACNTDTTTFLQRHVDRETSFLRQDATGQCVFLDPQRGCTVHAHRPLVCRLYPLGRHVSGVGVETFSVLEPQVGSAGEYGERHRVLDYLQEQGALPYLDAADELLAVFHAAWAQSDGGAGITGDPRGGAALDWLDVDQVLAAAQGGSADIADDVQSRFLSYLEVLRGGRPITKGGHDENTIE